MAIKDRRNFDIYSVKSIQQASDKNLLDPRRYNRDRISDMADSSTYNEDEYILTPCRFTPGGWKYVRKDLKQKLLNHPNKVNTLGYYGVLRANSVLADHHNSRLSEIQEHTPIKIIDNLYNN